MAKNTTIAVAIANRALDAITPRLNNGYLRIYSGSQPANPDAGIGGATLLAELRYNATAFTAAAAGVAAANVLTADNSANATGTAAWFRALESDGTTPVLDGTVGTATSDLILNTTSIVAQAQVSVTSHTLTLPQTP